MNLQTRNEPAPEPGGNPLLYWLDREAAHQKINSQMMAKKLFLTLGFITQLRNGMRTTDQLSDQAYEAIADFLHAPIAIVKLVAGREFR